MNLELLDPSLHDIPKRLEFSLSANADLPYYHLVEPGQAPQAPRTTFCTHTASALAFNRRGTYLAIGWTHGQVVIFDLFTRSVACRLPSHAHCVSTLSWSRDSSVLLTGSYDRRIRLWHLAGGAPLPSQERQLASFVFDEQVSHAQLHPGFVGLGRSPAASRVAIVLLVDGTLHLTQLRRDEEGGPCILSTLMQGSPPEHVCLSAVFDHVGESIFVGKGGKAGPGSLLVLSNEGGASAPWSSHSSKAMLGTAVHGLVLSRDGKWLAGLLNGRKVIRVFSTRRDADGQSMWTHDYKDSVNGVQFQAVVFGGNNAEWVVGASHRTYMYEVLMWSREEGVLLHQLEGPKVALLGLAWHPVRSMMVTASDPPPDPTLGEGGVPEPTVAANGSMLWQSKAGMGQVSPDLMGPVQFWCTDPNANWTAFAPDFQELDENLEYVEREDEFDKVDGGQDREVGLTLGDEDEDVDIETVFKVAAFLSDDSEDEREPFFIPTSPVVAGAASVFGKPAAAKAAEIGRASRHR